MSKQTKLEERLTLFDDNDELLAETLRIFEELKGSISHSDLYILRELIDHTSGLYDLASESISRKT